MPPLQKKTAAKFASQGDAYMRNNTQIKFLYNPLITETCCGLSAEIFKYIFSVRKVSLEICGIIFVVLKYCDDAMEKMFIIFKVVHDLLHSFVYIHW